MGYSQQARHVDLVIVGGGPTGLLSAVLARSLGLSVYIVDAKDTFLELGRADALNARTQQYLEVSKTLPLLEPFGLPCNTSSTFENGQFTSQQNRWWTSLTNCQRPNFLMIGQPQVEEALLHQLDVPVTYKNSVTSIAEFDSGVVVTTDHGKTVVAKYAIAADGARSFVRTALGIPFLGTKPGMVWAVLDTFIETDFPCCPEIITFQKDGQSRVSWIPRERGMSRFYVLLDGEITQKRAEVSIQEHMAPHKIEFKKTEWFSSFEVKERVASTFVSRDGEGRIILAGDAAHVHAVNGGQGLNTGIADAFNLVWRIAFAAKGFGGPVLLKSYDEERRATAEKVIDVAAKLVRSTVKTALEYVNLIEKSANYITGMGVSYPPSSALVRASSYADFVAGSRCPDLWVKTLPPTSLFIDATKESQSLFSSTKKRLYELFEYGRFKICFLGKEPSLQCLEQGIEMQQKVEFWHVHSGDKRVTNLIHEFQGDWVGEQATVVVIRPDTYVGYVGPDWQQYLDSVFA
ncbi:Monooxygenase, FAD-binding [Penicillium expansum]|uniref:Monooxygenase, FAD-binding n=1 Tax=Penicillium expansum TaxID=27334 RepID=A0A0A2KMR6_PENEN|nr:Monooxygenase, FAD-binding [Penicillium expansum]KGO39526.1 Monooxygenase, FAD-binding [Penicillium expansum]KGO56847.1 Monooxygenase, FAD-binding [Penicillium expansum]KGO69084.1 Monooxygenase, FAD-binding [Penicillium expansum]